MCDKSWGRGGFFCWTSLNLLLFLCINWVLRYFLSAPSRIGYIKTASLFDSWLDADVQHAMVVKLIVQRVFVVHVQIDRICSLRELSRNDRIVVWRALSCLHHQAVFGELDCNIFTLTPLNIELNLIALARHCWLVQIKTQNKTTLTTKAVREETVSGKERRGEKSNPNYNHTCAPTAEPSSFFENHKYNLILALCNGNCVATTRKAEKWEREREKAHDQYSERMRYFTLQGEDSCPFLFMLYIFVKGRGTCIISAAVTWK